jgi:HEAT repeat protein
MPLFGPPNIEKMEATGDVEGLMKALNYRKGRLSDLINVQIGAAQALGRIGDARAVKLLVEMLGRTDADLRQAGAAALAKIGAPAVEPLIGKFGYLGYYYGMSAAYSQTVIDALGKIGTPAVQPLLAALRDTSDDVRQMAAEALDKIGWQPEAGSEDGAAYWAAKVELLITTLKDRDVKTDVRQAAVDSLVKIGVPAVEPLIAMMALKDTKPDVRQAAVDSLAGIGGPAVEPLIAALGDSSTSEAAAAALKRMGPAAVEPLMAVLEDKDKFMQHSAVISALAAIGGKRAAESLAAFALGDEPGYMRLTAFGALSKIFNASSALQALEPDERVWWQKGLAGKCEKCGRIVLLSVARTETNEYWDGEWWQKSQPYYICPFCKSSSGSPSAKLLLI